MIWYMTGPYCSIFNLSCYIHIPHSYLINTHTQVVYVYGGENEFCAVKGINGQHVRYLPKEAIGVAQWFGVTAFLFCVHSMVRTSPHLAPSCCVLV